MSKNKVLSYFLGFLLFSSGDNDTAYGMDETTRNAGVGRSFDVKTWEFDVKTGQLGVYHLMIVSKYFKTIDDFINLELATPKAKGNMEKFHFNPIPLDSWSRKFFTSLETLHVYDRTDEHFTEEEFYKRVIWYPYDYTEDIAENTTYRNLVFTRKFVEDWFADLTEISVNNWPKINDKATKAALGNNCFSNWHNINTIELPTYITRLGEECFQYSSASKIVLPEHLREAGWECFSGCVKLAEIKLPNTCMEIDSFCFDWCASMTSVILPENIRALPYCGFGGCMSLKSIEIPTTVSFIDKVCFHHCHSLYSIKIPQSVTSLEELVFSTCTSLQNVILPDGLKKIGSDVFNECCNLTQLTIPSTVTYIDSTAFKGCTKLTIINKSNQLLQAELLGVAAVENEMAPKSQDSLFAQSSPLTSLSSITALTNWSTLAAPSGFVQSSHLTSLSSITALTKFE